MRLEGKVALISGGARGMGAEEARLFAQEGAKVVIGDLRESEGRQVEAEISERGGEILFLNLDVTSEESWVNAIGTAVARFGKLDILVNNAGLGAAGLVEDTTAADWDRVMEVNAKGVFLGTKAALPALRQAGGGSIINISSQLGIVGSDHSSPHYQASKGAVRLFTKNTAMQYAKDKIRVNSVHPGPIVTPMTETGRSNPDNYSRMIGKDTHGPLRPPRRSRLRRPLPSLRRSLLRHRQRARNRRRMDRPVARVTSLLPASRPRARLPPGGRCPHRGPAWRPRGLKSYSMLVASSARYQRRLSSVHRLESYSGQNPKCSLPLSMLAMRLYCHGKGSNSR